MAKAGNTIVIAAAIIAAIRLARVESLSRSPKVVGTISDAVVLARDIYVHASKVYPELFRD
jgi:hypothetical protein